MKYFPGWFRAWFCIGTFHPRAETTAGRRSVCTDSHSLPPLILATPMLSQHPCNFVHCLGIARQGFNDRRSVVAWGVRSRSSKTGYETSFLKNRKVMLRHSQELRGASAIKTTWQSQCIQNIRLVHKSMELSNNRSRSSGKEGPLILPWKPSRPVLLWNRYELLLTVHSRLLSGAGREAHTYRHEHGRVRFRTPRSWTWCLILSTRLGLGLNKKCWRPTTASS